MAISTGHKEQSVWYIFMWMIIKIRAPIESQYTNKNIKKWEISSILTEANMSLKGLKKTHAWKLSHLVTIVLLLKFIRIWRGTIRYSCLTPAREYIF